MMKTVVFEQPRHIAFWCHCCGQQVIEDHPLGWAGDECVTCSQVLHHAYQLLNAAIASQAFEDLASDDHNGEAIEARRWLRSVGLIATHHNEQTALSTER